MRPERMLSARLQNRLGLERAYLSADQSLHFGRKRKIRSERRIGQFLLEQLTLRETQHAAERVVCLGDREVQPRQNDADRILFKEFSKRLFTLSQRFLRKDMLRDVAGDQEK